MRPDPAFLKQLGFGGAASARCRGTASAFLWEDDEVSTGSDSERGR